MTFPKTTQLLIAAVFAACTGGGPPSLPSSTTSSTPPTSAVLPTGATADTGTSDPDTIEIYYNAYDEDRECWALRFVEKPTAIWGHWYDETCDQSIEHEKTYWIADGHCGEFQNALVGDCAVDDPTWLSKCDGSVHACCDDLHAGVFCFPDPYYQP